VTLKMTSLCGALVLASAAARAGGLEVQVELPDISVAEYHRPYVAVWIENNRGQHQMDLAVWYDHQMRNKEGNKWLKDLRLWWRRSGRSLDMPVDGFTGATRAPGTHYLSMESAEVQMSTLAPGDYALVVEAAREVGGREVVRVPFSWPVSSATGASAQGNNELGAVSLTVSP